MFQIGLGKEEIAFPIIPVAMLGHGNWDNRVSGKKTPLYVRSFVVKLPNKLLVFSNAEIGSIMPALRKEVLKQLAQLEKKYNVNEAELMLTAQHTHSAPGGFSHYPFYTFTTPGFRKEIFECYVKAIVNSIVEAIDNLQEGTIHFSTGKFKDNVGVAWNRSITAYNENKDIDKVNVDKDEHLAVDRNMYLLSFKDAKGECIGSANWFGVHTTSIGNKNTEVSFDNKGYAAKFLDENNKGINLFAQGKAGDISPHFHGDKQFKIRQENFKKGDHLHAEHNGRLQFEKAKEILAKDNSKVIEGEIRSNISYDNYSNLKVDPQFSDGKDVSTGNPCFGLAFFKGARVDGPGISHSMAGILSKINKVVNKKQKALKSTHGNKEVILDAEEKNMFGLKKMNVVPNFVDPQIKEMNKQAKLKALEEHSLIPTILPVQLFVLGNIAIIGFPGEITTVAGYRVEALVKDQLKEIGVEHVLLSSYANSYMGYVTTPEEYDLQLYEGGHTLFGKWTLAAFQTKIKALCIAIKNNEKPDLTVCPPDFSEKELALRTY